MSMTEQMHWLLSHVKKMADRLGRIPNAGEFKVELPNVNIDLLFGTYDKFLIASGLVKNEIRDTLSARKPIITIFDIECKPMKVWSWGLFDQNHSIDMIIEDWTVMSWAAKRVGENEVMYMDVSNKASYMDEYDVIKGIHDVLNESDVVITQNGVKFDSKKLNTKFEEYDLGPTKKYQHIDTLKIKKKNFALSSNKLEYSTNKFNDKFTKLKHGKFPGWSLWDECLKGNPEAWAEMKKYNIHDVLATEELYFDTLQKWDSTINYGVFTGVHGCCPNCGSTELEEKNVVYTKTGAFQTFKCAGCRTLSNSRDNLLNKSVKKGLLK